MDQRENSGVLFKNDRKDKESHPDYKGSVNVGGTEYWLSAWIKTGAKGKFMSLAVSPKDKAAPQQSREDQRKGERKRATEGPEPF